MGNRAKGRRAAAPERKGGVRTDIEGVRRFFEAIAARHPDRSKLAVVCIGTDRSTGDSFGPLIGTLLREEQWPCIVGTLDDPCDAEQLESKLSAIPEGKTVVAFDACLGKPDAAGKYVIADGPLHPARATGGALPPVGDYSVAGIVGPLTVKPYWSLQRASLYEVIGMAREIAAAFSAAWQTDKT